MAFITAAIVTALGLSAFGAAVTGFLVSTALSIGVSYLSQKYLGRKNKSQSRSYSAVQGDILVGGDIGLQAPFGLVATKGYRAYYAKWGAGNKYNAEVFVFGSGRCEGLDNYIWINGEKKTLLTLPATAAGNESAHYGITDYEGLFSIRFYDGALGQGVDQKLVDDTASIGNNWNSTSTGENLCYVVVERLYDAKFDGRRPDLLFVLKGLCCYDPRLDSTFSGGSGSHRLDTPSTWEYTQNPAIQRMNYQIGFKGQLSGATLIGMGKDMSNLDTASYIASANVSDTQRNGHDTYHCNLIVNSGDVHSDILAEFDDSMAGYGLNRAGLAGVLAGYPQVSSQTITDVDIRTDAPISRRYKRSAFDQVNYLSGQFTSVVNMFQPESIDPITNAADVASDGRTRTQTNDFLQVIDTRIAQYLLEIRYRQNRLGGQVILPVGVRVWFTAQVGDWVTYDSTTWLVTNKADGNLTLSETDASVYNETGIGTGPVINEPSIPINPSLITTVGNFAAAAGTLGSDDLSIRPALAFTWDPPDDPSITSVVITYQRVGGGTVSKAISTTPETGELVVDANVMSGSTYSCRATIVTVPDRFKTWTDYITTAIATVDETVFMRQAQDDIRQLMINLRSDVDNLKNTITADGSTQSSIETADSYLQRKVIQKSGDNTLARLIKEENLQATNNSSQAGLINAAQATADDGTATSLFKLEASAGPGTWDAQIAMLARATTDGGESYKEAGILINVNLDANGGGSEILLKADQTAVINTDDEILALFSDNGIFLPGRIPTITAGMIAADSITADEIAADTITANEIAINGITGNASAIVTSGSLVELGTYDQWTDVPGLSVNFTTTDNSTLYMHFDGNIRDYNQSMIVRYRFAINGVGVSIVPELQVSTVEQMVNLSHVEDYLTGQSITVTVQYYNVGALKYSQIKSRQLWLQHMKR